MAMAAIAYRLHTRYVLGTRLSTYVTPTCVSLRSVQPVTVIRVTILPVASAPGRFSPPPMVHRFGNVPSADFTSPAMCRFDKDPEGYCAVLTKLEDAPSGFIPTMCRFDNAPVGSSTVLKLEALFMMSMV